MHRHFLISSALLSLVLLILGVQQPMFTLQADLSRQAMIVEGKKILEERSMNPIMAALGTQLLDSVKLEGSSNVYKKTQSLFGTAKDLWNHGYFFIAMLIVIFSLIIPAIKLLIIITFAITKQQRLAHINSFLSKWSMADVFAIGTLIAYLAANASTNNPMIHFSAELHSGFYWFTVYCLSSVVLGQIFEQLKLQTDKTQIY